MSRLLTILLLALLLAFSRQATAQTRKSMDLCKKLLESKDPAERALAAQELGKMLDINESAARSALPSLREAIKDTDPAVRRAVVDAITRIETDPEQKLSLWQEVLKRETDAKARVKAITSIEAMGNQAKPALPVLLESNKILRERSATTDPEGERKAILRAVGRIDNDTEKYLPILMDTLKLDRDPGVLQATAVALGQIGPPAKDALPRLREIQRQSAASQPADPQGLRRAILQAVGRIDSDPKNHVPILVDALQTDRDLLVRVQVAQSLGQMGPPAKAAVPGLKAAQRASLLAKAAADDQGLRRTILQALGQIEPDAATRVPLLVEALTYDRDPGVRMLAVTALAEIGPAAKAAIPVLTALQKPAMNATPQEQNIARQAAAALQKIQGK